MINQVRLFDMVIQGKIKGIRQEQIIQVKADFIEDGKVEVLASQSQINIGSRFVIPLGAGTIQDDLFNTVISLKNSNDLIGAFNTEPGLGNSQI